MCTARGKSFKTQRKLKGKKTAGVRKGGRDICLNEVYKSSVGHFYTRCIFYVLILNVKNQKFYFLIKICEIRNKLWNA